MSEKTLLDDVMPEHYFYVHDGTVIKNIFELHDRLAIMSQETFAHHVNQDKNDFKSWTDVVLQDSLLATEFSEKPAQEDMIAAVRTRILSLTSSQGLSEEPEHSEEPINHKTHAEHINSGLLDFFGGIALGIIIGLFIAKLLLH
ncbi:MAG: hypothetical protein V1837_05850 [Candidatus Woesearchaeota archaeon]